jgi:hypothetical protein
VKRRRALTGVALVFLVFLGNGCNGCKGIGWKAKLTMAPRCNFIEDCEQTCPQGNMCMDFSEMGGPDHRVCVCREAYSPPCMTALDCDKFQKPGEIFDRLWNCTHYPGSSVGSCEYSAECATALDCKPIADCPEGPACALYRWGDRGACRCASKSLDGGAP